jgi:XTP/dITP diphosphohydrolase
MLKLLIATTNPGKLREIQAVLAREPLELILPMDHSLDFDVLETGSTYAENAALKALAYAQAANMLALADDSGLEVAALSGGPGLHSARYHPRPGANDADRRHYLLENLQGLPQPWAARFCCTVAIANPQGQVWYAQGECPGQIIVEERGSNGFGYDPVFYLPELGLTMAELDEAHKNQISHRSRALQAALPILQKIADPSR